MFYIERAKMLVFALPAIIVGLTVHEFSHAYAAHFLGDNSSELSNRLTLNPLTHIDPLGFLMLLLLGFGWAKPVVFDSRYFKNRRLSICMIAAAGPLSNFILGVIFAVIYGRLIGNYSFFIAAQSKSIEHLVLNLTFYMSVINFGLFVFNMIPIAPLDGSHFVTQILNLDYEKQAMYQKYGMIVLLILILSDTLLRIDLLPISKAINFLFSTFIFI